MLCLPKILSLQKQPLWLESALVHVLQAHGPGQQELMGSPSGVKEAVASLAVQALCLIDSPEVGRGFEEDWRVL